MNKFNIHFRQERDRLLKTGMSAEYVDGVGYGAVAGSNLFRQGRIPHLQQEDWAYLIGSGKTDYLKGWMDGVIKGYQYQMKMAELTPSVWTGG